jgi:hypothetical protein
MSKYFSLLMGLLAGLSSLPPQPQGRRAGSSVKKPTDLGGPAQGWGGKVSGRRDRHRMAVADKKPLAPKAKPTATRKRAQHHHPLRDAHGAYTLVGRVKVGDLTHRRKWLAGISAQQRDA